jgi:WD40 repeat protein
MKYTKTIRLFVNSLIIAQTLTLNASQARSLKTATSNQQQIQARLVQLAAARSYTTSAAYESKIDRSSYVNSSSSASNGNSPAICSRTVTAPASPEPDSQESPNSDIRYVENQHPTNLEREVFEALYTQLAEFPRELVSIIIGYCRTNISNLSSNEQMVQAQEISNAHANEIAALIPLSATKFASASTDCTIKLWELAGGKWTCTATLKEHKTALTALALLEKDWLLSGAANGEIKVWYLLDNKPKYTLQSTINKNPICSLAAISEDSFAAGSQTTIMVSPIITIWERTFDKKQGAVSWCPKQTLHVLYTPQFLVNISFKNQHYLACGFPNGAIHIYRDWNQSVTLEKTYEPTTASSLHALMYNSESNHLIAATFDSIITFEVPNLLPRQTTYTPEDGHSITTCSRASNNQIITATRHGYNASRIFCVQDPGVLQGSSFKEIINTASKEPIQHVMLIANKQLAIAQEKDIAIWECPITQNDTHKSCVIQ